MSFFRYKIIRRNGQVMAGIMNLPFSTEPCAHEYFEERGLTVITVQRISAWMGTLHKFFSSLWYHNIKTEELIEFLRNIGIMLRSGVSILVGLQDTTTHGGNRSLVKIAEDLRLDIESGFSFADAMDRHQNVFPHTVRNLIRIGEETGNLDRTLVDAAEHLSRLEQINTDIHKSLIYPAFALTSTLAAAAFWLYYVVPGVTDLFQQMNVDLPQFTVTLLSVSGFLQRNILFILIIILAVILVIYLAIKYFQPVRKQFHRLLITLPISGRIVEASNLAYIAEYFSLFSSSGVDILSSLKTLGHSIYNEVYREKIIEIREGLIRGNSLTDGFERSELFPSFVVRMVNVGEQSGNLDEQLRIVADDYRRRLNDTVDRIGEMIKPLAILLVGGLFVIIIIGLFLPIYDLIGQISTRHY